MGDMTDNFSRHEFACKCGDNGCVGKNGGVEISTSLVDLLQEVREAYGQMDINSGLRCPAHNTAEGGKPDSAHITGEAVDISCTTSTERLRLVPVLASKFNRIGIAQGFIHVDVSTNKGQGVMWVYK